MVEGIRDTAVSISYSFDFLWEKFLPEENPTIFG